MKKALVIRYGAFGDSLIITPVLRKLKQMGYHVVVETSERGQDIFLDNPNIDEVLFRKSREIDEDEIRRHWEKLEDEHKPDKTINFTGSIENNLSLHPTDPEYAWSKKERIAKCDKNFYEESFKWADLAVPEEPAGLRGEMFFNSDEHEMAQDHFNEDKFSILWCLSGSGQNKTYPWTEYVVGEIMTNLPDAEIVTVGNNRCSMISPEGVTNLSGQLSIRTSMLMTKYADLVVSPDTGILHASGMFDTPKIGLLGATTKENVTKHFVNDYSIEADCKCAPCFHLVYDSKIQCPIEPVTKATWCMAEGLKPERVWEEVRYVWQDSA